MTNDFEMSYRSRNKKIRKQIISKALLYVFFIAISAFFAGPFLWLLSTTFKAGENIYSMNLFTTHPTLTNYIGVIDFMNLPRILYNTTFITVVGTVLDIILAALCAYPLACMNFKGKGLIFGALTSTMIIPAAAGMIVNYLTIQKLHLVDKFGGVIIPGAVSVFSIILLRQAYLGIPRELIEAAKIDGASELKTWRKIMLPGVMPAISTLVIFNFISKWNAFLWPIIVLQDPQKYPLATALKYLGGQFNYKFGYIAAGTVISIIPVIIVFLMFQKNYINAVSGAIKG